MAQATFSVRMDENLKNQFDISAPAPEVTRDGAMQAFMALRSQAQKDFPEGMSIEEIDEEIRKDR